MAKIFTFNPEDGKKAETKETAKPEDGIAVIAEATLQHIDVIKTFMDANAKRLDKLAGICSDALKNGKKLMFCGNGGSASDAMHIATEFVGRFVGERKALPAIALTADSTLLTSVSNDYGYQSVFSRQVEGLGNKGDILVGITTSGNSQNVLNAVIAAKEKDIFTVALTGNNGGTINGMSHMTFIVEDTTTARIQESHILFLHLLCDLIEKKMGLQVNT